MSKNWTPEQRARYYENARKKAAERAIAAGRIPGKQGQPSKNRTPEQLREMRRIKSQKYRDENPEKSRKYKREYEQRRAAERAVAEGRVVGRTGPKPKYNTVEEQNAAIGATRRRYYQENKERERERARIREQKKRDAIRAGFEPLKRRPQTLEEKRAIKRAQTHARRASKLRAGGSFTAADAALARRRQNGICLICNRMLGEHDLHTDHWVPLAKGGSNGKENIAILHGACNLRKGVKHPSELGLASEPLAA